MRISVYVPQHAVIEAISPAYRLFKTANDFLAAAGKKPKFEVEYVGLHKSIKANDGEYSIKVDKLIDEIKKTDLIFIPALYGNMKTAVSRNAKAIPWLQQMHKKGAKVASLCIGAFLLGATGLVDGKKCSTHWAYCGEFKETYPKVEIVDGSIITEQGSVYSSGGANSLWNLLLYLLEKFTDRETAVLASKYFAIDIDRSSQSAFAMFTGQKHHSDKEILKAQEYIENNIHEKITTNVLATVTTLGRRTFERRFKDATHHSVLEYIQRIKIEAAKRQFENNRKNVNDIMYEVGYTDTKAFRDLFKKITGLTPIEYRNKYSKI
ncbi:MAG: helix-turn-helix domain-containing protein [Chitinophagaceae bacterium]|nr:helix-turn-helix domain-containing protein [Chitinophagaceae bacterium]